MTAQAEETDDYGLPLRTRHTATDLDGAYDGHTFWAHAPVDPIIARWYDADPARCEFVWLVRDGRLAWALVDVTEHQVVALDPKPRDGRTRAALAYRKTTIPQGDPA